MSIYDEDRGTYLDHRIDPFDDSEYKYQGINISINFVFDSKSKNDSIEIEKIYKIFIEKFNKYLESLQQTCNKSKPVFEPLDPDPNYNSTVTLQKGCIEYNSDNSIGLYIDLEYKYNDLLFIPYTHPTWNDPGNDNGIENLLHNDDIKEKIINPYITQLSNELTNNGFNNIETEIVELRYEEENDIYNRLSCEYDSWATKYNKE